MEKMVVKSNDIVRNVYILDGRSGCCSDDPLLPSAGVPLAGGGMSPTLKPAVFYRIVG